MKQKEIFLQSEGDAWFRRNQQGLAEKKLPDDDAILREILELLPRKGGEGTDALKLLEVGCGDGMRLAWLQANLNMECAGIEPSAQAVEAASKEGVRAQQGTADSLPFGSNAFDIVIFGFCLYLCDRDDLFRIASEADRVLRSPGWLVIKDFFSPTPRARTYVHRTGVWSYKMDYRTLFTWHPAYECMTHKIRHHREFSYTDDPEEWVSISVLRKCNKDESA